MPALSLSPGQKVRSPVGFVAAQGTFRSTCEAAVSTTATRVGGVVVVCFAHPGYVGLLSGLLAENS
jgi:hypothetical protein